MKDLQISQNKMLRLLNNSRISNKISTASLLLKFNMLSVNQINAQIKLSEMWKAVKDGDHPFNLVKKESGPNVRSMRSITNEVLPMQSFSELSKKTFINDGIKAWNKAPAKIKDCITYASAKNEIKKFVKTIPIWFINFYSLIFFIMCIFCSFNSIQHNMHTPFLIYKSLVLKRNKHLLTDLLYYKVIALKFKSSLIFLTKPKLFCLNWEKVEI